MKNQKTSELPKKKRIIFKILLILLPILSLLTFELILQLLNYGENLDLFIPASSPYTNYKKCNPSVGKRYFFQQSTLPLPANDIFLAQKPPDGYRIFVLGGSTTLGFPYGNLLMFSRILNRRLQDTFPEKRIEVVNVALTAINSYTLVDFMDEILAETPDAILIYAGHNEFYGALGVASLESVGNQRWIALTYMRLMRFKLFRLLRDCFNKLRKITQKTFKIGNDTINGTLMERLVSKHTIKYNSKLFNRGIKQFENNLRKIFQKAEQADVPIIISELVSNVCHLKPFFSQSDKNELTAERLYQQAQQFEKQKQYDPAQQAYYRAKDLDGLRFRAPEAFNQIIHQEATRINAPVVPMKSFFEKASPHGLIGDNLMVDHLHPNIDGYFLMADAFYETMRLNHFITDHWDSLYILPANHYRHTWPFTALDSTVATLMIHQLKGGWPFKPKLTENRILLDFEPQSLVESLALKVIFNEMSIDEAHFALAQQYEKQKHYKRATEEYDAFTYLVFIEAYAYLNRAKAFIRAEKDEQALHLLLKSLEHEEIPLANRLIGEIYLKKADYKNAVNYLEKARQKNPNNPELLASLCIAYLKNLQFEKANLSFNQFKSKYPDNPQIDYLKNVFKLNPNETIKRR